MHALQILVAFLLFLMSGFFGLVEGYVYLFFAKLFGSRFLGMTDLEEAAVYGATASSKRLTLGVTASINHSLLVF